MEKKDFAQALHWLGKSTDQGYAESIEYLKRVVQSNSAQELKDWANEAIIKLEKVKILSLHSTKENNDVLVKKLGEKSNLQEQKEIKQPKQEEVELEDAEEKQPRYTETMEYLKRVVESDSKQELKDWAKETILNYYRLKPVGWITLAKRIKRFKALHRKISNVTDPS